MAERPALTTDNGMPIADNQNSITAGPHGPVLMQGFHLLAVHSLILVVLFTGAAHANDIDAVAYSKQELQAKLSYCEECHGSSAQGFRGYYPIPRLAGQQTEYLKNQLQAFVEHRRKNNIMFNVAHVLNPAITAALAANFHELNPKPAEAGPKELIAKGKMIFDEGIPDANVPACSSCHGTEAKGDGQFPRLAGQLFDYISNTLTDWDRERGQVPADPDTSAIMQPIARSLTMSQIKAVAAYLSSLE
jgi:cytochrome c553